MRRFIEKTQCLLYTKAEIVTKLEQEEDLEKAMRIYTQCEPENVYDDAVQWKIVPAAIERSRDSNLNEELLEWCGYYRCRQRQSDRSTKTSLRHPIYDGEI